MPSMNVSLTTELMHFIQSKVDSGFYNNASEVIRDALRQLDTNSQLLAQMKTERLRAALTEGVAQIGRGDTKPLSLSDILTSLGG